MKKFLDVADRFTQIATAGVLALFAVACMFAGCSFNSDGYEPIPPVGLNSSATQKETDSTIREIRTVEPTTEREETRPAYLDMGKFKLTAYCSCKQCCGIWADGITATGTIPVQGRTIAVDEDVIPYGSEVIINGQIYIAEDTGGSIIGNHIDIYFDSHEEAEAFGVQYGQVVLKVGDSE